jgi:hypothetical protein
MVRFFRTGGKKKAAKRSSPPPLIQTLDGLEIDGLGALGVRLHIERDLLAFGQSAHAGRFDGGGVHEHILVAAFRRDEAKALGGVEEFDGADSHFGMPLQKIAPRRMPERRGLSGQGRLAVWPGAHGAGRGLNSALLLTGRRRPFSLRPKRGISK